METLEIFGSRSIVGHLDAIGSVVECPELLEEAEGTIDAGCVPRLRLLDRTEEHLINAESVGTILVADIVRVDNIIFRFRHLLYSRRAEELAIGIELEFCVVVFWSPLLECLNVKGFACDDIDIDMDWCCLILVLEVGTHILVGAVDAVSKTARTLNHALVDELLEWLFALHYIDVLEELVPET